MRRETRGTNARDNMHCDTSRGKHRVTKNFGSRQFLYKKTKKIIGQAPCTTVASKHSFDDRNLPQTSSHKRRKTARKTNGKHARCALNGQHAAKVRHSPLCCAGGHHRFGTSRCLWMLFVTIGFRRLYKHRQ
uniref:Uncharacterized protein n=1 Tax=Rhipicephalus zambeziensis TaxID=60191 RepID=A0A224YJR0_9ACAR